MEDATEAELNTLCLFLENVSYLLVTNCTDSLLLHPGYYCSTLSMKKNYQLGHDQCLKVLCL